MALDFDPFSRGWRADPYAVYRTLRKEAPVHRGPVSGFYCVSRYEDVLSVLKRPELFSSRAMFTVLLNGGQEGLPPLSWNMARFLARFVLRLRANPFSLTRARNLISEDPPVHETLRAVVNRAFTPRCIAALEPRIRELVHQQVAPLTRGEDFDVVGELAVPLPVMIIAELLGIEPERRVDFKRWSDAFIDGMTGPGRGEPFAPRFTESVLEFLSYIRHTVRRRRRSPGNDIISTILADAPGGEALSDIEVLMFVQLLLVAGNETTTNLIGNAVHALLDHREEIERLQAEPALIPALVEEALRFDCPVQIVFRTARAALDVAGTLIPAGATLALLLGSANRDERRFPDPDRFDVGRDTRGHLAFGFGEHFCLGSALARLEARVALDALVPELVRVERKSSERALVDSFLVRGSQRLDVRRVA